MAFHKLKAPAKLLSDLTTNYPILKLKLIPINLHVLVMKKKRKKTSALPQKPLFSFVSAAQFELTRIVKKIIGVVR